MSTAPIIKAIAAILRAAPWAAGCAVLPITALPCLAQAEDAAMADQVYAVHGQTTFTVQSTPGFASAYAGANSLIPNQTRETIDATLYAGLRPWAGGEIWINPEIDQGFGLANTLGVAGFPSAEAYKVGKSRPYFKLPRLFWRQVIGLGGDATTQDPSANQLRQRRQTDNLVVTLGKFGVVDVFDTNSYAHDPRGDFLNWAMVDAGAFDYAANAWGFTFGGSLEWNRRNMTLRTGLFDISKRPNQPELETDFSQYQTIAEGEWRLRLANHPGAVRLGGWFGRARLTRLADALDYAAVHRTIPADLAPLRRYTDHYGAYVNAEQEVATNWGVFARASAGDGTTEADDFTDIDRSVSVGAQVQGAAWGRAADKAGLAGVIDTISRRRQAFLADGGLGTLVGDGKLPHPGAERIVEAWYALALPATVPGHWRLTADYQFIANPAYNRDRGPVHVFGLRLHADI